MAVGYRERQDPGPLPGAPPFDILDIRPGEQTFFGAAPGAGKTAALLQIGIELLRLNENARLLIANVEMPPAKLLSRIVSRLSGVPLTSVRNRTLSPSQLECVRLAVDTLESIADRLAFLHSPFSVEHLAAEAKAFQANVLVVDYVQRFTAGDTKDKRVQLESAASMLRELCHGGATVLVASAVSRQKGPTGSNYKNLNLASIRDTSEFDFGADNVYLFNRGDHGIVTLNCGKARDGEQIDIVTRFDGRVQEFSQVAGGGC